VRQLRIVEQQQIAHPPFVPIDVVVVQHAIEDRLLQRPPLFLIDTRKAHEQFADIELFAAVDRIAQHDGMRHFDMVDVVVRRGRTTGALQRAQALQHLLRHVQRRHARRRKARDAAALGGNQTVKRCERRRRLTVFLIGMPVVRVVAAEAERTVLIVVQVGQIADRGIRGRERDAIGGLGRAAVANRRAEAVDVFVRQHLIAKQQHAELTEQIANLGDVVGGALSDVTGANLQAEARMKSRSCHETLLGCRDGYDQRGSMASGSLVDVNALSRVCNFLAGFSALEADELPRIRQPAEVEAHRHAP
jgi:hypothetical protein